MKVVVTGSAGHLGEALVRTLERAGHQACGLDLLAAPSTVRVGSILDRHAVRDCLAGADAVIHAATLHKPHVATHPNQQFVDINITGTLTLPEVAVEAKLRAFIFTTRRRVGVFRRTLVLDYHGMPSPR